MRMRLHALLLIAVTASVSGHSAAAAEPEQIPTIAEGQATALDAVEWRFSEPQPDWKVALPAAGMGTARLERTADGLRVTLSDDLASSNRPRNRTLIGSIYVDLPNWRREQWAEVVVRTRTTAAVGWMEIGLNPREGTLPAGATRRRFRRGAASPRSCVTASSTHTAFTWIGGISEPARG